MARGSMIYSQQRSKEAAQKVTFEVRPESPERRNPLKILSQRILHFKMRILEGHPEYSFRKFGGPDRM